MAGYISIGDNYRMYAGNMLGTSTEYKSEYYGNSSEGSTNYSADINLLRKGEAIWETSTSGAGSSSWNGDTSIFANMQYPFLTSGGRWIDNLKAGIFSFCRSGGYGTDYEGFRAVLIVE